MNSQLRQAVALSLVLLAVVQSFAWAQDQVRTWGIRYALDTEAFQAPVAQVSSAIDRDLTVVVTRDGRLLAFGFNWRDVALPPAAPVGGRFIGADAGGVPVAQLAGGQLIQWDSFQIGWTPPTMPPSLPPGMHWLDLASTPFRSFAIRSDGVIVSWGTTGPGLDLVPVLSGGLTYVSVAAGAYFAVALVSDGTVRVWGLNVSNVQSVPAIPAGLSYTRISAGLEHVVALRSDGQIIAWGNNLHGQCAVPALAPGLQWIDAVAGGAHTVGLRSDGKWVAWGLNDKGQCNVPVASSGRYKNVIGGHSHTVGVRQDGKIEVWGLFQTPPQLGAAEAYRDFDTTPAGASVLALGTDGGLQPLFASTPSPPVLPGGVDYTACSVGYDFYLGLGSDGVIRAWGSNVHGQLNVPPLPSGTVYTAIDAGSQTAVALRTDGGAVAWGLNAFGQTAIPPLPAGKTYVDVSAGSHNVLLLRSDGTALLTAAGPLSAIQAPPPLPAGLRYTAVACGNVIAAALRSDGSLVSWGSVNASVPALPPGLSYVEVECGDSHAVARRSDGVVVTWGPPLYTTAVPSPGAQRSYLRVAANFEASAGLIGNASSYVPIGPGCAGSLPAARLVPRDTPQIGRSLPVLVTSLPADAALLVFGWSRLQPPVSLAPFGVAPCLAHVSLDVAVFIAGSGSEAPFELAVPYNLSLVGLTFFNQAVVLDPAGNSLGAVLSEAMAATIGG